MKKLQQLSISDQPNGTTTSVLSQTKNSCSTEVDSVFFQTKPDIFGITDIVNNHFEQNSTIKINGSFNSATQAQAEKTTLQNLNPSACSSNTVINNENVAASKIDKLQASLDRLTLYVENLQRSSDKVFDLMENLTTKIDAISENIVEIKQENRILKKKLKDMEENMFI